MQTIIHKSINSFTKTPQPQISFILQLQHFSSLPKITKNENQESFTVRYLMNQFGFPLKKAILASKDVEFKKPDKPDKVVSFFKKQGFLDSQIQHMVSVRGRVLTSNIEKTLLPKIEFFRSKGVEKSDLAKIITLSPNILERSVKRHIEPAFEFLRDYLGSDECVIHMLKRDVRSLGSVERRFKPNINVLSQAGLPYSSIAYLLKNHPHLFGSRGDKLRESVEEVGRMGMDPESCTYGIALSILRVMSRSKWNEKMEAYKRWGCSEDEVLASFKILPWIMAVSIEKLNGVMSFCVNEMCWKPSEVVRTYSLLTLSLNKRIVPRWSVYQELVSKDLIKGEVKLRWLFAMKEDLFLEKYVNCYKDEAPSLLKLYCEKLEASK